LELSSVPSVLNSFINERAYRIPAARLSFKKFADEFRSWLPDEEALDWPRSRLLAELAALGEFPIGADSSGTTCIGGLSLSPPRLARYNAVEGRLVLAG
jgi:hypothetical protein